MFTVTTEVDPPGLGILYLLEIDLDERSIIKIGITDSVMIGSDYCYEINDDGDLEISDNELMVLYVAVTRAKRNIDIGGISDIITKLDDF